MKNLKSITIMLILTSSVILSCKKQGCTYIDSKNYDIEAEEDDGSCEGYTAYEILTSGTWTFSKATSISKTLADSLGSILIGRKITYFINGTYNYVQNGNMITGTWEISLENTNDKGSEDYIHVLIEDKGTSNELYYHVRTHKIDELEVLPIRSDHKKFVGNELYSSPVSYYYIK